MSKLKRHLFTEQEDNMIIEAVKKVGLRDAANQLEITLGRNRRIIKERYLNVLDPSLNPVFTEENDKQLLKLVKLEGQCWKKISLIMGDKSQSQVKGRYNVLKSKIKRGLIKKSGARSKNYVERHNLIRRAKEPSQPEQIIEEPSFKQDFNAEDLFINMTSYDDILKEVPDTDLGMPFITDI